jgi:hypothetical protein
MPSRLHNIVDVQMWDIKSFVGSHLNACEKAPNRKQVRSLPAGVCSNFKDLRVSLADFADKFLVRTQKAGV